METSKRQGVDFFNGEDALLAHVKADKDLRVRLNLTNIMVRPNAKSEKRQTPNKMKKTKKQEAEEATERRRRLSSFTNIWGGANAQGMFNVLTPKTTLTVTPVMARKVNTKTTQTLLNRKGMMKTKKLRRFQ
ncbi:hypothetical protein PInf_019150 [Phytophthora infestans]|nr:hypothetical protein PInf_019150 [Phytophthora infestans]